MGVKVKGYASNAADFAQTEEVVNQVKADFGSIDILVNNAGITKDVSMSAPVSPRAFTPQACKAATTFLFTRPP